MEENIFVTHDHLSTNTVLSFCRNLFHSVALLDFPEWTRVKKLRYFPLNSSVPWIRRFVASWVITLSLPLRQHTYLYAFSFLFFVSLASYQQDGQGGDVLSLLQILSHQPANFLYATSTLFNLSLSSLNFASIISTYIYFSTLLLSTTLPPSFLFLTTVHIFHTFFSSYLSSYTLQTHTLVLSDSSIIQSFHLLPPLSPGWTGWGLGRGWCLWSRWSRRKESVSLRF